MKYNENNKSCTPSLWGRVVVGLLIFALMFLLSGCKQSRAFETKTDSVSVQSLHVEDSLRSDFSFLFDRLDMWFLDSMDVDSPRVLPLNKMVKHVAIQGGHITNSKTENHIKQVVDSATMKSQEVIHPVNVPPKIPASFVIGVLVIITFVIYASRVHK